MTAAIALSTTTPATLESDQPQPEKGSLMGRIVAPIPASEGDNKAKGGGATLCCVVALGLIAGGIMFAVAQDSCEDPNEDCDKKLLNAGKYTMIACGSVLGALAALTGCCWCIKCACFAGAAAQQQDLFDAVLHPGRFG